MNLSYFSSLCLSKSLKISSCEFVKIRALCSAVTKESDSEVDEAREQLLLERQEDREQKEMYLEKRRNKSRLYPQHRQMVHDQVPWTEETPVPYNYVKTVRYNRRLYGRYGNASNVDPRISWPSEKDLAYKVDYESVLCPKTIQQMVEEEKEKIRLKEKEIRENDAQIAANLTKMDQWKTELKAKLTKKSQIANEAKSKRDRLIEEVRRRIGYEISPKDPRFDEMIEAKEKEEKKAKKEAKKKQMQEEMIAKMLKMAEDDKKEREEKKQARPTDTDKGTEKE